MSNTKLSSDIDSVIAAINSAEKNGSIAFKVEGKKDNTSQYNNNLVVDFVEKVSEGKFVRFEIDSARQSESWGLMHRESGRIVKIHTYSGKGKNDLLTSNSAILSCVLGKEIPNHRKQIIEIMKNTKPSDIIDNAPYVLSVDFSKTVGNRTCINHLFDLNLTSNIAGPKLQTNFSIVEERLTPQEFFNSFIKLLDDSITPTQSLIEVCKALVTE